MLSDPVPMSSRRDFFDREVEIEGVKSLSSPVTLVLALNSFTARVTRQGALSPQAAEASL